MPHYAKSRFHGHSCVVLPITASLRTKAAVDSRRGMLRFIFHVSMSVQRRANVPRFAEAPSLQARRLYARLLKKRGGEGGSGSGGGEISDFQFFPFHLCPFAVQHNTTKCGMEIKG